MVESPFTESSAPPRSLIPLWVGLVQCATAGGLGGWLWRDTASWRGWLLIALAMVVPLTLSEVLRWWDVSRSSRHYSPLALLTMVVLVGVIGGLVVSVFIGWPLALLVVAVLAFVPGMDMHEWWRGLGGVAAGVLIFGMTLIVQRWRRVGVAGSPAPGAQVEPGDIPSNRPQD